MKDLIEALQIFLKYGNPDFPTNCINGELHVDVNPAIVSEEDKAALEKLSFSPCDYGFYSFKFGSN